MTTIVRVRTDWTNRYHVQVDADASVLDAFIIELPPYETGTATWVHSYDGGKGMDELFQNALLELQRLRAKPHRPLFGREVFVPFGVITARNYEEICRERELATLSFVGGVEDCGHPDHAERVRALSRMLDILDGAPLPVAGPWPVTSIPH